MGCAQRSTAEGREETEPSQWRAIACANDKIACALRRVIRRHICSHKRQHKADKPCAHRGVPSIRIALLRGGDEVVAERRDFHKGGSPVAVVWSSARRGYTPPRKLNPPCENPAPSRRKGPVYKHKLGL